MDWINLLHDKDNQQSHVNKVITREVSKIVANFVISQENTRFSRRLCSMELVQSLHCSSYFMSGYYLESGITSVYVENGLANGLGVTVKIIMSYV
jgi:hypothetical protein